MSAVDPRTPVLVGAAAHHQRVEDPADALEAAGLLRLVAAAAAADAGVPALLEQVDLVLVPEGTWRYPDPGRLIGAAASARTVLAHVGVLQQSLFTRAAQEIAAGTAGVVLVAGAEAKYRSLRASITGTPAPDTEQPGVTPSEVMAPEQDILSQVEITRELAWPVRQYAIVESALRHADGQTLAEHADALDGLGARFSAVAAANPLALTRTALAPDELRPSEVNPMLASPYTKRHASQWNVDQASALILCSVGTAERLGIAPDRWVFPHVGIESNHMLATSERADLHRSPAMAVAGDRLAATGVAPAEVDHLDLYSCFPVAVRMQARELGIDETRQLTVTGGMTFAGGPLNNYALQALAAMVEVLRADPGSTGLVTSVSGMLTKYGLGLWSTRPPETGFVAEDISDAVARASRVVEVDPDHEGPAVVAGYTVVHDRGVPSTAVVLADTPDGRRAVATSTDPDDVATLAAPTGADHVGAAVTVTGPTFRLAG